MHTAMLRPLPSSARTRSFSGRASGRRGTDRPADGDAAAQRTTTRQKRNSKKKDDEPRSWSTTTSRAPTRSSGGHRDRRCEHQAKVALFLFRSINFTAVGRIRHRLVSKYDPQLEQHAADAAAAAGGRRRAGLIGDAEPSLGRVGLARHVRQAAGGRETSSSSSPGQAIHLNTSRTTARPWRCAVTASTVFGDPLSTACSSVSRGRTSCRCSQALKRA